MHFSEKVSRLTESPINWLIRYALENPQVISFAAGLVDSHSLPKNMVAHLASQVGSLDLQYGVTGGQPNLKKALLKQWPEFQDLSIENVLITTGGQQFLYLLAEALLNPGDIVLVESPSYFVFRDTLLSFGATIIELKCDSEGLLPDSLSKTLQDLEQKGLLNKIKFLYSVSYCQNPTGVTLSIERKQSILKILEKYPETLFVEDAAYRDLHFNKAPLSTISLENSKEQCVYTSTFSKPFCPGLKTGFGVAPQKLIDVMVRLKGNHDFGSSRWNQELLCRALESGVYGSVKKELIELYSHKAKVMHELMKKHFPKAAIWVEPSGGLYFWINLTIPTGRDSKLFATCLENDVLYVPGEYCALEANDEIKNSLRLSFGNVSIEELENGVLRLAKSIESSSS